MVGRWRRAGALGLTVALWLAGCGGSATSVARSATAATTTTATATTDPAVDAPTATAGPPCRGGRWGNVTGYAGPLIPLPPLTVTGPAEYTPSGGWSAHYLSLCTGGNLETVSAFVNAHMPAEGWSLTAPPADCVCNGLLVWSRPGDGRLAQFDAHPTLLGGDVRWSVTIFTKP